MRPVIPALSLLFALAPAGYAQGLRDKAAPAAVKGSAVGQAERAAAFKKARELINADALKAIGAYLSDSCGEEKADVSVLFSGKVKIEKKYYRCKDGSVTFEQPDSEGYFDWEGKCGETALSNTIKMTCGKAWLPGGVIDDVSSDWSAGSMPSTLQNTINDFAKASDCGDKRWSYYDTAESREDFLASVVDGLKSGSKFYRKRLDETSVRRAPVIVMIALPGEKVLHWVTVVDVEGYDASKKMAANAACVAYVNQWDSQYKIPCHHLAKMADNVGDVLSGWGETFTGRFVRLKQVD